jgi:hypothetical protein
MGWKQTVKHTANIVNGGRGYWDRATDFEMPALSRTI